MRIALDARMMFRPQRRGISKSLIRLYRELRAIRPDWQITGYLRSEQKDAASEKLAYELGVTQRVIEMPGDRYDLWQRYRLPLAAWSDGADLLHCPENHFPAWTPLPTVATIHDLIPLDMPYGRATAEVQRFEQSVRGAVQRAAIITTPSEYTRERLIKSCTADPKTVVTIPWSSDDAITNHRQNTEKNTEKNTRILCERFALNDRIVLHFGSIEPRKNTRRLIDAWHAIPQAARKNGSLCIVGLDAEGKQAFADQIARHGVTGVSLHGYVSDADAAALLCAASVLAYPSLSEGFGLPILDAFAAKTAVLTSTVTSLPEVAGDAAVLIDPTDPVAMSSALQTIFTDEHERTMLVSRGTERLNRYAWADAAERFAGVLQRAANRHARDTTPDQKRAA